MSKVSSMTNVALELKDRLSSQKKLLSNTSVTKTREHSAENLIQQHRGKKHVDEALNFSTNPITGGTQVLERNIT